MKDLLSLTPPWFLFREKYWNDPVAFALECIDWGENEAPTDYQLDILRLVADNNRVSYRGPRGLGKSTTGAIIVLWFALTRDLDLTGDWKVITTASSWQQLEKYLWPEIHKWIPRLRWDRIGREPFSYGSELLQRDIKLKRGYATAVASDKPDLLEGAHAVHLLYHSMQLKVHSVMQELIVGMKQKL